jgi:gliding motility associated protien GldN
MMKKFFRNILIGLFSLSAASAVAQTDISFFTETGEILSNLPTTIDMSEREPVEYNNPRVDDVVWQQVVYRIIDLREKINYPLYFPEEESDNRRSLFTTIFRLYEDDKIKAYEYQDGKEIFTENELVPFDEFVKTYDILITYKTDSISGDTLSKEIDESNIPNREILKYYAKEVWYFDKHNSVFNVRLIALCPIWYRQDYDMGLQKSPLFWIRYDELRPYLAKQEALISDRNNGARESMDDLFIKRRFGSYIFKASSTMNRNLLQYNSTAEEMHKEQERIKTAIINFEQDLWEY